MQHSALTITKKAAKQHGIAIATPLKKRGELQAPPTCPTRDEALVPARVPATKFEPNRIV